MNITQFVKEKNYIFFPVLAIFFIVMTALVVYNVISLLIAVILSGILFSFLLIMWYLQKKPRKAKIKSKGELSSIEFFSLIGKLLTDRPNIHFAIVDPQFDGNEFKTVYAGAKGHETGFKIAKCSDPEDNTYAIFCRDNIHALFEKGRDKSLYDVFLRNWSYLKQGKTETPLQFDKRVMTAMNEMSPVPQRIAKKHFVVPEGSQMIEYEEVEKEKIEDKEVI